MLTLARAGAVAEEIMETVGEYVYTMGATVAEFLNIDCYTVHATTFHVPLPWLHGVLPL